MLVEMICLLLQKMWVKEDLSIIIIRWLLLSITHLSISLKQPSPVLIIVRFGRSTDNTTCLTLTS